MDTYEKLAYKYTIDNDGKYPIFDLIKDIKKEAQKERDEYLLKKYFNPDRETDIESLHRELSDN